jgi:hypothetical protein
MLETLDNAEIEFIGDGEAKEQGYRALAHFWKGYAYARIGSMYEQGLVLDVFGATTGNYVPRADILAESNRQLDLAIASAAGLDAIPDAIPDLMTDEEVGKPNAASLAAAANTLKARNLLVNTRRADMTPGDWQTIKTLAEAGLQSNDNTFVIRSDNVTYPDEVWYIPQAAYGQNGWHRASERLIQDIQPGDARSAYFEQTTDEGGAPISWNTRSRGIQYNSSWIISDYYATDAATEETTKWYVVSYEENQLMLAEAELGLGNAAAAAALVDEVRSYQNAGLDPVDPTGDVFEQIRSERRVGLFLRGLAFYDARRWGVLDPVSQGGGRTGAVVIANDGTVNTNAVMNYNFTAYWPIPDAELDFNKPDGGEPGAPD